MHFLRSNSDSLFLPPATKLGQGYYRPKRSFGQGNIFTSVCLSTGGVPAPNFRGGACSKFSGGCLLQIFGGVPAPNFRGGCLLQIFGGGACSKFSGGSPIFGIWSTFGRYASYWNAFLCFYTSVILFTGGGGWYPSMHCRWYPSMPCSRSPRGGWYPSMPCRFPGPHPRGS